MNITVSIIIPTFNRSSVLDKCLQSVLDQTLAPDEYEVIIVDDCSTDDTEIKCQHYAQQHSNIRYIRNHTNQGSARTRNNGIQVARGTLLIFLDNDLLIDRDFIRQHIRCHNQSSFAKICALSDITYAPEFLKETNYGRFIQSRAIGYRKPSDSEVLDLTNLPGNFFAGGGSSCSRTNVIENGMFNTSLKKYGCEDELFGYHFVKNGGRVVFEPQAKLIHYDKNIGPVYWKRKYIEMGRYSLKEIYDNERDYFENSNYKYLQQPDFKTDSLKTFFVKLVIGTISWGIFRMPIEFFVMKTDRYPLLYCEPVYRYITLAWMKFGFSTQQPIEKVEY